MTGLQFAQQQAPVFTAQQFAFQCLGRIAESEPHQKAVELRFGQRIGAGLVQRVLGGDDEEGHRQLVRFTIQRDLVFFHGLEQCALGLRACCG